MRYGIIGGLICWIIIIFGISQCEASEDFSVGLLLSSIHPLKDDYDCFGTQRDLNEENEGIMFRYKYLIVARYENSFAGCAGTRFSNLIGVEAPLGDTGPVKWSVTAALADGYTDFGGGFGKTKTRPWASINAQIGLFKVHYAYEAIGFGLEWDL